MKTRNHEICATYMPNNSNFSSTEGALKLRTNSPYSVMSRFRRSPPLQKRKEHKNVNTVEEGKDIRHLLFRSVMRKITVDVKESMITRNTKQ